MNRYAFVTAEAVQLAFAAATARHQRILHDCFCDLATHPFRPPDFIETDSAGRKVSVISHDEWLISYWADHAIRQIVIVEIVFVDGA